MAIRSLHAHVAQAHRLGRPAFADAFAPRGRTAQRRCQAQVRADSQASSPPGTPRPRPAAPLGVSARSTSLSSASSSRTQRPSDELEAASDGAATAAAAAAPAGQLSDADMVLWLCEQGRAEHLRALLVAQAPTDARLYNGLTPLMVAVLHGHPACVALLLAAGADPNLADESGTTALHLAAVGGHVLIAQQLCQASGVALHARLKTPEGETPLDLAQMVDAQWAKQLHDLIDGVARL